MQLSDAPNDRNDLLLLIFNNAVLQKKEKTENLCASVRNEF